MGVALCWKLARRFVAEACEIGIPEDVAPGQSRPDESRNTMDAGERMKRAWGRKSA